MRARRRLRAGALGLLAVAGAHAAGGHHGVDDAGLLEPGACKIETWASRGGGDRLLHLGTGCRVGAFELGASAEPARAQGQSEAGYALQAKWTTELAPGFSAGVSVAPSWQAHARPRLQGTSVVTLWSWAARDNLSLHLNLGRDFNRGAPDANRAGVDAEWTFAPGWQLIGERYHEDRTHFARIGARWTFAEGWSTDLSRAQRLAGPGASAWTLGLTWQFQRR